MNEDVTVIESATITLTGPHLAVVLRALRAGTYDLVQPIIESIEGQLRAQFVRPAAPPTNGKAKGVKNDRPN